MVKRVFVVHGWDGHPAEGWFPWLKKELEKRGYLVNVLRMGLFFVKISECSG